MLQGDRLLCAAASTLSQLPRRIVYLGGSTTHLHLSDPSAPAPELTDDVDVVVDVSSPVEFQVFLRQELRALGAKEDTSEDAPTCRWLIGDLQVDVMSPNEEVLGFSNQWYPLALQTALPCSLPDGNEILLIWSPVFLATKLEAYGDRGRDCLSSKDVEDIVALVDGRRELIEEILQAPQELQVFVAHSLAKLRNEADFEYAVDGYLHEHPDRTPEALARIDNIISACHKGAEPTAP